MRAKLIFAVTILSGFIPIAGLLGAAAHAQSTIPSKQTLAQQEKAFRNGLDAYHARKYNQAMRFWLGPAANGNVKSQSGIGYLYFKGLGVKQSDRKAMAWYAIAAAQGEPTAQYHMGLMYLRGKAVPRNLSEAYLWCDLAMKSGYPEGYYCREDASRGLSVDQKEKAERRGRLMMQGPRS